MTTRETHQRFRAREFWEQKYSAARDIMRRVFILNEARPLKPLEIMALRDDVAARLNEAFPELEAEVKALWIKPMMTEDSVFCGLEFVNPSLFFDAIMAAYDDDPLQIAEADDE